MNKHNKMQKQRSRYRDQIGDCQREGSRGREKKNSWKLRGTNFQVAK